MKPLTLLFLTITAIFTSGVYSLNQQITATPSIQQNNTYKKLLAISCTPQYIPGTDDAIPALTGWGNYSWTVTTQSDSAQFYFNQGINMYYAFHIIEARASFDKATRFDPACAMAWWGKALAYGPNINDFEYQRPNEALPSALKANLLKNDGNAIEKGLIEAMAVRYNEESGTDQQELNVLYSKAMGELYKTYTTNENVAALYADALMLLHPWDLYHHDYTPKPWTDEIITVIEQIIKNNPNHPGAHHYYIHAVEASSKPGKALKSATFLSNAMPMVSHLTHMPSHIYIRTGNYVQGIKLNDDAVKGYQQYSARFPAVKENIFLYDLHNQHMKANCAQMAGNYKIAQQASLQLVQNIPSQYLSLPGALGNYIQYLHQTLLFTQLRFGKWSEIINTATNDSLSFTPILQHFAKGIAYARTNKINEAKNELAALTNKMDNAVLKEPLVPFNAAYDAAQIAQLLLQGVILEEQKQYTEAIKNFKNAVVKEDHLIYTEPRDWLLPARQYLGNCLLKTDHFTEALAVFNDDLKINPRNGWALTGITLAYKGINDKNAFDAAQKQLSTAWLIKDLPVSRPVF